eukprot:scaffold68834_cov22-Tisochrysis_lutea.AAC.2
MPAVPCASVEWKQLSNRNRAVLAALNTWVWGLGACNQTSPACRNGVELLNNSISGTQTQPDSLELVHLVAAHFYNCLSRGFACPGCPARFGLAQVIILCQSEVMQEQRLSCAQVAHELSGVSGVLCGADLPFPPSLLLQAQAEVLHDWVGLRPGRTRVRLEAEIVEVTLPPAEQSSSSKDISDSKDYPP